MSIQVERLPNEPIIIATLSGDLTPDIVQEMFELSAILMDEIDGRAYRLTDIRYAEISFPELVQVLSKSSSGQPGSPSDPRLCGVMVGIHGWSRFFADSMRQSQYGELDILLFDDFDVAMDYLFEQITLDQLDRAV